MSEELHKYAVKHSRYIVLPNNRLVGLANVNKLETNDSAMLLYFRSKSGGKTSVTLSVEAFEALKKLIFDPNAGDGGQIDITIASDIAQESTQIVWALIDKN